MKARSVLAALSVGLVVALVLLDLGAASPGDLSAVHARVEALRGAGGCEQCHASDGLVAGCVDCHLPHDFFGKYLAKGQNGWSHSVAFTLQNFHEPIQITPKNAAILQETCIGCHEALVHELAAGAVAADPQAVQCVHCHQGVGHGERAGLGGPETDYEKSLSSVITQGVSQ